MGQPYRRIQIYQNTKTPKSGQTLKNICWNVDLKPHSKSPQHVTSKKYLKNCYPIKARKKSGEGKTNDIRCSLKIIHVVSFNFHIFLLNVPPVRHLRHASPVQTGGTLSKTTVDLKVTMWNKPQRNCKRKNDLCRNLSFSWFVEFSVHAFATWCFCIRTVKSWSSVQTIASRILCR